MILSFKLPGWRILYEQVPNFKVSIVYVRVHFIVDIRRMEMAIYDEFQFFSLYIMMFCHPVTKMQIYITFQYFYGFFTLELTNLFIFLSISFIGTLLNNSSHLSMENSPETRDSETECEYRACREWLCL